MGVVAEGRRAVADGGQRGCRHCVDGVFPLPVCDIKGDGVGSIRESAHQEGDRGSEEGGWPAQLLVCREDDPVVRGVVQHVATSGR